MIGPVYFVTDPTAPLPVVDQALRAAWGGARTIQLRDKTASDRALIALAQALRSALPASVALLVNDRVEVALAAGLSGLHIGQSDGDPRVIRTRIGADMILGLSIDCEAQIAQVPRDCLDYLGVGPVRATPTKPDHAPPIGFDGLARIVARTSLPCVAIGGLGTGDCAAVKATGAQGLAVVSAIARAPDPEAAARGLAVEWGAP